MNDITPQSSESPLIRFEVRIPRHRIAMLIGNQGTTKKKVEQETHTTLEIDSVEGDVTITGQDVVSGYVTKDVVRAIGRGFNPEIALYLLKGDFAFELVDMSEQAKSQKALIRLKGRIIGQEGRSRQLIEKLLNVYVSVQGKTIGVIGTIERVMAARHALDMLIDGAPHATVYRWMEQKRRSLAEAELGAQMPIKESFQKYLKPK